MKEQTTIAYKYLYVWEQLQLNQYNFSKWCSLGAQRCLSTPVRLWWLVTDICPTPKAVDLNQMMQLSCLTCWSKPVWKPDHSHFAGLKPNIAGLKQYEDGFSHDVVLMPNTAGDEDVITVMMWLWDPKLLVWTSTTTIIIDKYWSFQAKYCCWSELTITLGRRM